MQNQKASCLIIAEAGVNHNGSIGTALKLVELAALCGADIVKFQSFKADSLVTKTVPAAEYQKSNTDIKNQYDLLKGLELSDEDVTKIYDCCIFNKIEFMSTPFDIDSANFLLQLGMKRFKIPSGEITNTKLIEDLAAFNKQIILSTGMSSLKEIQTAIKKISDVRKKLRFTEPLAEKLTLLHCTSNYPASLKNINLRAIQTMRQETNLPIGYSDHSEGCLVPIAAVALGATVIEKHFTLDKNMIGPDHKASSNPEELEYLVQQIRGVELALGSSEKKICESERSIRDLVRKSVTLKYDKLAGDIVYEEDLVLLRPGTGIAPEELNMVVGKKLKTDMGGGSTVQWSDLSD